MISISRPLLLCCVLAPGSAMAQLRSTGSSAASSNFRPISANAPSREIASFRIQQLGAGGSIARYGYVQGNASSGFSNAGTAFLRTAARTPAEPADASARPRQVYNSFVHRTGTEVRSYGDRQFSLRRGTSDGTVARVGPRIYVQRGRDVTGTPTFVRFDQRNRIGVQAVTLHGLIYNGGHGRASVPRR
jgi:hypothetical protein